MIFFSAKLTRFVIATSFIHGHPLMIAVYLIDNSIMYILNSLLIFHLVFHCSLFVTEDNMGSNAKGRKS